MTSSPYRKLALITALTLLAGAILVLSLAESPFLRIPAVVALVGLAAMAALWVGWRILRWFFWRVGRRLAFSYFLIGVLPIPMVATLLFLAGYLLAGYYMGTLYRHAARTLQDDLDHRAESTLHATELTRSFPPRETEDGCAYYEGGHRVAGSPDAPDRWPETPAGDSPTYYSLPDGSPSLVGRYENGTRGVLVLPTRPTPTELTERSSVWISFVEAGSSELGSAVSVQLGQSELALRTPRSPEADAARRLFFELDEDEGSPPLRRRPFLWWSEIADPPRDLETGEASSQRITISMNSSPRSLLDQLFTGSPEVNTSVWAGVIGATGLLTSIYSIAFLMAAFMIISLSRAVNQLSSATDSIQAGDFSTRIPVRREDQLGELQRSFNAMAENLESLVATAAQKELIDQELKIARDLQRSLLPTSLPTSDRVAFATLFEPSAAIGGDYYDVLSLAPERMGILVADVSGHGLPTGLHMAMVKSALHVLVAEVDSAEEIMTRLHEMIQAERQRHFFVTATLAVVDFERDELHLTNAGHPPTYLIRDGVVEEILLPGNPLGAIEPRFGKRSIPLRPADTLVWLSDGLIEAADAEGEPFGYSRLRSVLAEGGGDPRETRDRLVQAVTKHVGSDRVDDDRTLVAMVYRPPTEPSDSGSTIPSSP